MSPAPRLVGPRSPAVLLPLLALLAPACVRYRPLALDAPTADARVPVVRVSGLTFEDAVRRLVDGNLELAALRQEAAAVNLQPGPSPLVASMEVEDQ